MRKASLLVLLFVHIALVVTDAEARGRRWRRGRTYQQSYASVSFTGGPQQVADKKARHMAARCAMFHPGGGFGGAHAEGVGAGMSPAHALGNCCFTGQRRVAGQACYQGSNGVWYACKLYW